MLNDFMIELMYDLLKDITLIMYEKVNYSINDSMNSCIDDSMNDKMNDCMRHLINIKHNN